MGGLVDGRAGTRERGEAARYYSVHSKGYSSGVTFGLETSVRVGWGTCAGCVGGKVGRMVSKGKSLWLPFKACDGQMLWSCRMVCAAAPGRVT